MGTVLASIDNMLGQASAQGMWSRFYTSRIAAVTTAATVDCGRISAQRYPNSLVMPTMGGSVSGAYITTARMFQEDVGTMLMMGLEVPLGTLTVSGNSFAAGSTMPQRDIPGYTSVQLSSMITMIEVSTVLAGATTPTLTITYTDQDGNTGQSAVLVLPTNPALSSAYMVTPHLAAGDTGVRAVTNMSISTGSSGVLKAYGLVPLHMSNAGVGSQPMSPDTLTAPRLLVKLLAGDILSFYRFAGTTTNNILATVAAVGDN